MCAAQQRAHACKRERARLRDALPVVPRNRPQPIRFVAWPTRPSSQERFDCKRSPRHPISCQLRSVHRTADLLPLLLGWLLALITAALFASARNAFAVGPGSAAASPRFAPGRILVAPQPGSATVDFQQALRAQGGRSLGPLQGIDVHVVAGASRQRTRPPLRVSPRTLYVRFAELDQLASPAATVNDPYFR